MFSIEGPVHAFVTLIIMMFLLSGIVIFCQWRTIKELRAKVKSVSNVAVSTPVIPTPTVLSDRESKLLKYSFLWTRADDKTNFTKKEIEFIYDLLAVSKDIDMELFTAIMWTNTEFDKKARNKSKKTWGLAQVTTDEMLKWINDEGLFYKDISDAIDDPCVHFLKITYDLRQAITRLIEKKEEVTKKNIIKEYYGGSEFAYRKTRLYLWKVYGIDIEK